jgi:hypothetical protein
MRNIKRICCYLSCVTLLFIISSCGDLLNPLLPEWEVKLTIPITKDYILGDFVEELDDQRITFDPSRDSQLVFNANLSLNQINLNSPEQIQITFPTYNGKICLSDIEFILKESFIFQEQSPALLPGVPMNTNTPVPPIYGLPIQKNNQLNSFNELRVDTAEFDLEIINDFPFDINLSNFILSNNLSNHNEEILRKSEIRIAKNSRINNTELFINKNIFNSLKLNFNMSSDGTGSNSVYIDERYALKISFIPKRLKMFYAEASFDEQDYSFSIESELTNTGNAVILNDIKLKNGIVDIALQNYTNLNGNFIISTNEIHQNSNSFSTEIYLPAKGNFSQNYSLANYNISPKNNSELTFNNSLSIPSTNNQFVTINGNDSITYSISLRDTELYSFSGAITIDVNQSFMLEKEDIANYLNGNVNIKEASASIVVNNGSSLQIKINDSYISGYHIKKGETFTCKIKNTEIQPSGNTRIDIDNAEFTKFLNNFTNDNSIPNVFNFQSQVYASTNNSSYVLSDKDSIGGHVELKIPLDIAFSNLSTSGSTDIDISQSLKEELENLNFGTIKINCANRVPLEGHLRIIFMDDYGNGISFPKQNLDTKYIISAPNVDSRGYSIHESISTITDTFTKEDINFIKECSTCTFDVILNSSSGGNVVLRNSDKIKLSILTEFGYTIKNK